jgi:hypothetical protein
MRHLPKGATRRVGQNIPFEVAVHNREEDLEEEIDGIYQHRQKVQPRFARHHVECRMCVVELELNSRCGDGCDITRLATTLIAWLLKLLGGLGELEASLVTQQTTVTAIVAGI